MEHENKGSVSDDRWITKEIGGHIFFQAKTPEIMTEFLENMMKAIRSLGGSPSTNNLSK